MEAEQTVSDVEVQKKALAAELTDFMSKPVDKETFINELLAIFTRNNRPSLIKKNIPRVKKVLTYVSSPIFEMVCKSEHLYEIYMYDMLDDECYKHVCNLFGEMSKFQEQQPDPEPEPEGLLKAASSSDSSKEPSPAKVPSRKQSRIKPILDEEMTESQIVVLSSDSTGTPPEYKGAINQRKKAKATEAAEAKAQAKKNIFICTPPHLKYKRKPKHQQQQEILKTLKTSSILGVHRASTTKSIVTTPSKQIEISEGAIIKPKNRQLTIEEAFGNSASASTKNKDEQPQAMEDEDEEQQQQQNCILV